MDKEQRPLHFEQARLARLPRRPDLVLQGTLLSLDVTIVEEGATFAPSVTLWIEPRTHLLRAERVFNPAQSTDGGVSEALAALVEALCDPLGFMPAGTVPALITELVAQPGLPGRVRVGEKRLARAVRALLEPLGTTVDYTAALPSLADVIALLRSTLEAHADDGPVWPFTWEIDAALLPPLFTAAAAFARAAPWDYLLDHPSFALTLGAAGPQDGVETLYASVMGAAGQLYGVAFYYSLDAFRRATGDGEDLPPTDPAAVTAAVALLRVQGVPVKEFPDAVLRDMVSRWPPETSGQEPEPDALVLYLDSVQETNAGYLDWLAPHGLPLASTAQIPLFVRTSGGHEPQTPTAREVRALTLALEGLVVFLARFRREVRDPLVALTALPLVAAVAVDEGAHTLEVRWPGDL